MALTKVTGSVIKDSVSLSGNVSVGGTLTYQDVTNVDALGIGTFRTGIKVLAGQVDVGSNIKLGNAGVITATSFVGNIGGTPTFSGDITIPDKIVHAGDTNTAIRFPSVDTVTIETGGSQRFRVDSSGTTHTTQVNGVIGAIIKNTAHDSQLQILATYANKNSVIFFGDAADDDVGQIDYDHNDNSLRFVVNTSERLRINSSGDFSIGNDSNFTAGAKVEIRDTIGGGGGTGLVLNDIGSSGALEGLHIEWRSGSDKQADQCRIGQTSNSTGSGSNFFIATNSGDSGSSTERLRILSTGQVGINQSNPARALTVNALGTGTSSRLVRLATQDNSTRFDFSFENANNLTIQNGSSDAAIVKLHTSGYVTKPSQPYFKANKTSSVRITSTGYQVFENVLHNNGSHYNNSDGKFTAPVNGLYWFSCRINAYDRIDFTIRVNGTIVEKGQYNTDNDQVGWWSNQLTTIVYMTAGQYTQVHVSFLDQQSDPGDWCTFMGYLLS